MHHVLSLTEKSGAGQHFYLHNYTSHLQQNKIQFKVYWQIPA